MKTFLSSFFLASLIAYCFSGFGKMINDSEAGSSTLQSEENVLQILSSPELAELTSNWVAGYHQLHPELKITTGLMDDNTAVEPGSIYLLTPNQQAIVTSERTWQMAIAHELIVPIFNANNPLFEEIYTRGISSEDFAMILSDNPNWSNVLNGSPSHPIQTFVVEEQQVISNIADFMGTDESAVRATKITSPKKLIAAVQKDKYAIGFCKLTDVLNPKTNDWINSIRILPIDRNRNNRLDSFENIYSTPDQLTRGAWLGKYPRALRNNIYAVASFEKVNQTAMNFLIWLNKDGQNDLGNSGFVVLSSREQKANLLAMSQPIASPEEPAAAAPLISSGWKLTIGLIVIIFGIVLILSRQKRQNNIQSEDIATNPALNENTVLAPAGLYYSKSHTWAYREPNGMIIVGIDDFMQHLTGPLTQVKMRLSGEKVSKGEKIMTLVREGRQLELYSPVSGTISLQNERLNNQPDGINSAPYTDGWVYLIEPSNWYREIRFLFTIEKYREWLEDEFIRLKDFLAASANTNQTVFNHLILQDGGELIDNVLANLDPEVWEDFQTEFIDKAR